VAVGTANFIEPRCTIQIIDGIQKYCIRKGVKNINELIGSLEVG
jgi:dihydroorotate dehydrogenase (NAD+) catalytic subunit